MFSIENYLYSLYHQAHTNLNQLQVPKVPIKLQFHQLLTFFDQQFTIPIDSDDSELSDFYSVRQYGKYIIIIIISSNLF